MGDFIGVTAKNRQTCFSVKEVARYLGLAEITVYRLTEQGKIPAKKVGAQWRYMRDEIDNWLRERR